MSWDGIKIEEKKMYADKLDRNNATQLNFSGHCFKNCANRDIKCDVCFKFSELIEIESKYK
jgi:hypothetical protein